MTIRHDDVTPINTAGMAFFEITKITVFEWHKLPDGQGKPEQLHLEIEIAGFPHPFIARFKSRRPVDELIVGLMAHVNNVWPRE